MARHWRLRRDVRESYVSAAKRVEQSLGPLSSVISPALLETQANGQRSIDSLETFLALERALMQHVEHALLASADETLLALAQSRLSRFWADVTPPIQAHWALIAAAAEVLLEADRVAKALKKAPTTVPALVRAYAEGDAPWCLLDTHHRHMESRWYNFEPEPVTDHGSLEKLIIKAEQRYTEVGSELAKHFVTQFQKAKHPVKGLLRQRDVFETQVKPKLDRGQDRLRLGRCPAVRDGPRTVPTCSRTTSTSPCSRPSGTLPTITEIGMAALLPKADESAKVVAVGGGKLGLEIDGTVIKDRKDRVAFLKAHAGVPVFDAKLDDLLPKPSKKVRDGIQNAATGPDHLAGDRRTLRGGQHHPGPSPDGRRAQRPAAGRPHPGRPRHQDDRPRRRPRPPVRRRDRRRHEDRRPRRRDRGPASARLGRRRRHLGAVVPADPAGVAWVWTATSTSPRRGPSPASSPRGERGRTSTAGCRPRS